MKQVIHVLGTSYCGSTVLNQLLNTMPGVRGFNELWHFYEPDTEAYCSNCECHMSECKLATQLDKTKLWSSLFEAYPDMHVIVETSKHPTLLELCPPVPETFKNQFLVLYKLPHEFAWSYLVHENLTTTEANLRKAWAVGLEVYQAIKTYLDSNSLDAVPCIAYEYLCPGGDAFLDLQLAALKLPPTALATRRNPWQKTKSPATCMFGGNNAVYAQTTANRAFFEEEVTHLTAKYQGKYHQVFYDDSWQKNPNYLDLCHKLYGVSSFEAYRQRIRDHFARKDRLAAIVDIYTL